MRLSKLLPKRRAWRVLFLVGLILPVPAGVMGSRLIDQAADRLTTARRYELGTDMKRIVATPGAEGLALEKFTFTTADGLTLRAMIVEADTTSSGEAALEKSRASLRTHLPSLEAMPSGQYRGTILMMHGINSREEHMLWHARWLVAAGFRCMAWDSRGHGESEGTTVTFGKHEVNDAARALAALHARREPGPVLAYGHSMGAAILLQWLATAPPVKGAVAVAPFARLSDIMNAQADHVAGGLLKFMIPLVRREVKQRAGFDPAEISPQGRVGDITCPVFFIHGEQDQVIPVAQSAALRDACRVPGSRRTVTPGGHGDALSAGGTALQAEVVKFYMDAAGSGWR